MQAAGGLVDLGIELTAGMQRRHDDFERRLVLELGVRIDRNAATVIGDGEVAFLVEFHFDEGGVAGHRLIHRVVDDFGEQVVQRLVVGAADIHAGTATNGLQTFQNLNVGRTVAVARRGGRCRWRGTRSGLALRRCRLGRFRTFHIGMRPGGRHSGEEVVVVVHEACCFLSANQPAVCHGLQGKAKPVPVPFGVCGRRFTRKRGRAPRGARQLRRSSPQLGEMIRFIEGWIAVRPVGRTKGRSSL